MKPRSVTDFDERLLNAQFNDSYDRVIIPYDHKDMVVKLYDQFSTEFYGGNTDVNPFQDEGVIWDYNRKKDTPNRVVQWERLDDDNLLVTCSVWSKDDEYPSITLYEGIDFPVVSHKIEVPRFWFKFRLSDRCISDLQAYLASEEPKDVVARILTPSVQRDILNKVIYENKFELECVNVLMFVFWYANRAPERVEHDASKDEHRSKREIKEIKNHHGNINRSIPLVKKVFVIKCEKSDLQKIKRSAPDHMVHVRGHYRRYKNGKTIYINPFTKYNDKPDTHSKTYVV